MPEGLVTEQGWDYLVGPIVVSAALVWLAVDLLVKLLATKPGDNGSTANAPVVQGDPIEVERVHP